MKESIEQLSNMPQKIKSLQLDCLRNQNKLVDETRKMEAQYDRIAKLEEMQNKALQI